jgi:circadian clock protein KaiB
VTDLEAPGCPDDKEGGDDDYFRLHLYVAGNAPKSLAAIKHLRQVCEAHLAGRYEINLIDLEANPGLAVRDQIVAIPTLVRRLPPPVRRIVGDLSNTSKVLVGLEIGNKDEQP